RDKSGVSLAGPAVGAVHPGGPRLPPTPLLGGLPRYNPHIRVGLPRQATPASKPVANPPRSRIVGGCREPEVSEFAPQVAQELCRVGDCFDWIKGVGKTARARSRRHELRHALRPCTAYRRRIEAALLPDQPGEEIDRQIIFSRCRRERITDARDGGRTV